MVFITWKRIFVACIQWDVFQWKNWLNDFSFQLLHVNSLLNSFLSYSVCWKITHLRSCKIKIRVIWNSLRKHKLNLALHFSLVPCFDVHICIRICFHNILVHEGTSLDFNRFDHCRINSLYCLVFSHDCWNFDLI